MGKQRLTITLSASILKKVDQYIDGVQIRNRSHAIESLLEQTLTPTIDTAVVLAGGVRSTEGEISALKKISGRYVLAIALDALREVGITRVIICAGSATEAIQAVFGTGSQWGVTLRYTSEPQPLGTAGALKLAEPFLHEGTSFFVIHGDILSDLDFRALLEFHLNEDALATIVVKPALGDTKYGHVYLKGNRIDQFLDSSEKKGISIINTGMYLLKTDVLSLIPPNKKLFLEQDIFPRLAQQGELSAFVFQGFWRDVVSSAASNSM